MGRTTRASRRKQAAEKKQLDRCLKLRRRAAAWLAAIIAFAFLVTCLCGCAYRGAKVVEGTDLAIGINAPISEGTLHLQVLNFLSGFRLGVDRDAELEVHYTVSETNSYFGCVTTRTAKTIAATVVPVEKNVSTNGTAEAEFR